MKRYMEQAQEDSLDRWQSDKIAELTKGTLTPVREQVIAELNRKRRKEGIYAWRKCHHVRSGKV